MPALYLVTYRHLASSPEGRAAAAEHRLPPFVDGSIRREPDLDHAKPGISCLCRAGMFAPRLRDGDVVVYMTKKHRDEQGNRRHRVTAVLIVESLFDNHAQAAAWYRGQGLPLPSNCMVRGNPAMPLNKSVRGGGCDPGCEHAAWDASYSERARTNGRFVVCEKWWDNLTETAPSIDDEGLCAAFGYVPGTRNPGALHLKHLPALCEQLGIDAPPSSP